MNFQQTYLKNPEDLPKKWEEAWNNKDATSLANLFTEDAEFVNVVGLWWHNRKDIWKAHEYGLRVIFNNSTIKVRRVEKKVISPEVVIIHSRMKLEGQTSVGNMHQPGDRMNIFTFVMKKEKKGWTCVSAHNTDVVPGKETNAIDKNGALQSVNYRS